VSGVAIAWIVIVTLAGFAAFVAFVVSAYLVGFRDQLTRVYASMFVLAVICDAGLLYAINVLN
jgi:hypothetical protein